MSSSLSSVPESVSPWRVLHPVDGNLPPVLNNNITQPPSHPSVNGISQTLQPCSQNNKRKREATPFDVVDERQRSTSNEEVEQNASAPSFNEIVNTEDTAEGSGASSMGSNKALEIHGRTLIGSEGEESGDSILFSEERNVRSEHTGQEVEDSDQFLPINEHDEQVTENRHALTTSTEALTEPLPLTGETCSGDIYQDHMVDMEQTKASHYLPQPIQAIVESSSTTKDEVFKVPRLPTPFKPTFSAVQPLNHHPAATTEYIDLDEEEEDQDEDEDAEIQAGSYHSGDSDEYHMECRPILERTAVKKDIRNFSQKISKIGVSKEYKVRDRLGEGTFSSVYLAEDMLQMRYDNMYWSGNEPEKNRKKAMAKGMYDTKRVALKKILATSSPGRIENELHILESLRGCRNVSQLITAWREEDQIIIALPFHKTDDFRYFYRHMDHDHIRKYMRSLLTSLKDIHGRGIIHRDVKPANFLFDYEAAEGVLCDFGLAERYTPPRKATCQHSEAHLATLHGSKRQSSDRAVVDQAVYDARKRSKLGEGKVGFLQEDKRGAVKTNRAGTRGFRAPEVLLKCPDQTVAIDVWSAGIMLLSILTHKFPIFNSNDDIEALMELAAIFGRLSLEKCALMHNRTIICNVPTLDNQPASLKHLVLKLNPHIYTPPISHPTKEQAEAHIHAIDDAIDLCTRLLRLDPTKRSTAAQALQHRFFDIGHGVERETGELLRGTEGKCGELHGYDEHGRHYAYFKEDIVDMHFGMGIPNSIYELCPEHLHFQQRTGQNVTSLSVQYLDDQGECWGDDQSQYTSDWSTNNTPPKPIPSTQSKSTVKTQTDIIGEQKRKALAEMDDNFNLKTGTVGAVGDACIASHKDLGVIKGNDGRRKILIKGRKKRAERVGHEERYKKLYGDYWKVGTEGSCGDQHF